MIFLAGGGKEGHREGKGFRFRSGQSHELKHE